MSDRIDAANALIDWFESQGLSPGEGGNIMIAVVAATIADQKRDDLEVLKGLQAFMDDLMTVIISLRKARQK